MTGASSSQSTIGLQRRAEHMYSQALLATPEKVNGIKRTAPFTGISTDGIHQAPKLTLEILPSDFFSDHLTLTKPWEG